MASKRRTIRSCVSSMIERLNGESQKAKSEKAAWRHAFADPICGNIKAWGLLQRDMPKDLKREYGDASYEEKAVYMAVAAYAACGAKTDNMTLGSAAAVLGPGHRERFTRLENSPDIDTLWRNLKDILRLISSKNGKGIDYGLLACDLYDWQFNRVTAARNWERNYYNIEGQEETNE